MQSTSLLAPFQDQKTIALTTYRRNGEAVSTAVHVIVDGDVAVVRTWDTSGKAKRIRRTPDVTISPSDNRGKPTGSAIPMHAELVNGTDTTRWSAMLARKYPIVQGALVQRVHKLLGRRTAYIRLTPADHSMPAQARNEAGS
ncbi:MAG: PPOX class F420-dependent oxidoreductase [Thermomicrobiales bacterium]